MYKVLQENVMVVANNQWINTTVVLTKARGGGLQVNYTDANGMIVKREAYSKSPYYGKAKKEEAEKVTN